MFSTRKHNLYWGVPSPTTERLCMRFHIPSEPEPEPKENPEGAYPPEFIRNTSAQLSFRRFRSEASLSRCSPEMCQLLSASSILIITGKRSSGSKRRTAPRIISNKIRPLTIPFHKISEVSLYNFPKRKSPQSLGVLTRFENTRNYTARETSVHWPARVAPN